MRTSVVALLVSAAAFGDQIKVGSLAPEFAPPDVEGKVVKLSDYKGKTVVLEWFNPECPFVNAAHTKGSLVGTAKRITEKGVVWLAVNSTTKSSSDYTDPAALTAQLTKFGAAQAGYLVDEPGIMGRAYGAKTTPHMYIIDPSGKLVYNGAIDDKRSTNLDDVKTAKNYVVAALDEMKAGKPVSVASTAPYGCSVKYR